MNLLTVEKLHKSFGNKILFGCKQVLEEDIGFTGTRFTLYIL